MKYLYLFFGIFVYSNALIAESFNFGFYPAVGSYTIKTDDGDTERKGLFQPIDFFASYEINRDARVWVEIEALEEDFSASSKKLGGSFESTDLSFQYQMRYRATRSFKPWFGAGVIFSQYDFTNRHLVDEHGYLMEQLESQSENNIGLVVSMTLQSELDFAELIYGVKYKASLGDGINGLSFNIGLQF